MSKAIHFSSALVAVLLSSIAGASDITSDVPRSVASAGNLESLSIVPPILVPPAPVTVTFGQNLGPAQPFSVTVTVADPNGGGNVLTLAVGSPVPASITGLAISPPSSTDTPATFQITGNVAYQPFGTVVTVPLVASNGVTSSQGSLVLTVIPEPSMLALLGLTGLIRRRR